MPHETINDEATLFDQPAMPVDPAALTIAQAAAMLRAGAYGGATGGVDVEAAVREAIAAGAPLNPDGRLHFVRLTAWLLQQVGAVAGGTNE